MTGRTPKLHSCLCLWQSTMSCWKLLHLFQSISPFKDIHKCSLWGMSSISQRPIPMFDSSFAGTFFWLLSISVGIHCLAKHLQCQASTSEFAGCPSDRILDSWKAKAGCTVWKMYLQISGKNLTIYCTLHEYISHTQIDIYIYVCVCDSHIYNMNIYNYI